MEIQQETAKDATLQTVITYITKGWPSTQKQYSPVANRYCNDHHSLTYLDCLLLKGDRTVILTSLRKEMLQKVHEGHLEMDKGKRFTSYYILFTSLI